MSLPDLLSAAARNFYTPAEYAERYFIRASMERANAQLRRSWSTPADKRDAAICARLAGRYLARAHTLNAHVADGE